jgi:hypothetical protein
VLISIIVFHQRGHVGHRVALLFASGEDEPLAVKIGVLRGGIPEVSNLDYIPWLTGSADAPPPNHSDVEVLATINSGETFRHIVIFVDQNHPPQLRFPAQACVDKMLNGISSGWKGNIIVLRRDSADFVDMSPTICRWLTTWYSGKVLAVYLELN